MKLMSEILKWLPYVAIVLVYLTGANLDIMEVDAAQYASISLEMLKSGEYLQVYDRYTDYLDKPPLLFWLSALSMKLLGMGTWQYKLPSILFSLIGLFSTHKLASRLYSEQIARHASMILGGSLAMVMINNDIKTDTILVASIVFSIWMLVAYIQSKSVKFILGASIGIACAMLTKGPIGLVMPALAIGGHLVVTRNWKSLLDWKWIILLVGVAILLIPMCMGLYQQYGNEGLKFYFWTQSFGRITGENTWQNDTTPLYFTHVFLWSFLPWTLIAIAGLFSEVKNIKRKFSEADPEFYLISGIVLVWVALSLSRFKLPHYIFVVYPLIAILTAKYVDGLQSFSRWAWTQLILSGTAVLFLIFILRYCFPEGGWIVPIVLLLFVVVAVIYFLMSYRSSQIISTTFFLSIALGLGLNLHFYPQLLPYQANSMVGKWIHENEIPDGKIVTFLSGGRAVEFYAHRIIPWNTNAEKTSKKALETGMIVYTTEEHYLELQEFGLPKRAVVYENFEVQRLSLQFLNPATRSKATKKNYLLFY